MTPKPPDIRIGYDEFRRALLQAGMGWKEKDNKALFKALGGESGGAQIDMLRQAVPKHALVEKEAGTSLKPPPAEHVPGARAERVLREAMRKSHHLVKLSLEKVIQSKCDVADFFGRRIPTVTLL